VNMTMEQDASLRRLSGLVSRYIQLGAHLQKCRDLMPQAHPSLIEINRVIAIAHQEMKSFEYALAELAEDSMILHDDLRRAKFQKRKIAGAIHTGWNNAKDKTA
jgi:hypothetical protein